MVYDQNKSELLLEVMTMARRSFRYLTLILVASYLMGCATVPLTQRSQLKLLPDGELAKMGLDSYREVLSQSKLSSDPKEVEPVVRVGKRLAAAAEQYMKDQGLSTASYQWEFNVIKDDKTANAWCMPGGKVAVYTGIFPYTQTDAGLAVVMSHEIAHALANHGNERMSQGLLAQLGGLALSEALASRPEATRNLWMSVYGVGAQYGAILPYSRLQENEADHLGLIFMAMAGYDPNEAVALWQRMAAQKGGAAPPEFRSTHPADATRIANIRRLIPEAMRYYTK